MFGLFGLGAAAKPKTIAPPAPPKPDPKIAAAQKKVQSDINEIAKFQATTPITPEWSAYLECLKRRLNDINIVCQVPTTSLAKVKQMYAQAQAQAKKDAAAVVTAQKKTDAAAATVAKKDAAAAATAAKKAATVQKKADATAAKQAKKLANGQTIQIDPKENSAIDALQAQLADTNKQIADAKTKIAQVKAQRAKGIKPNALVATGKTLRGLGGLGFLGAAVKGPLVTVGQLQIDCGQKKNVQICAIASLTQQTQDQMTGLIQTLMDKQTELEDLLNQLSALVASTPTAEDISAEILQTLPTPATADEIGEAVGTKINDTLTSIITPPPQYPYGYDPTLAPQAPYYAQPQPGSYPAGTVIVDPYTGQPINQLPQQYAPQQTMTDPNVFDFGSQQDIQYAPQQPPMQNYPAGSGIQFLDTSDAAASQLPNLDDLLNDFGDDSYGDDGYSGGRSSGMFGMRGLAGLGCGEKKTCGCGN